MRPLPFKRFFEPVLTRASAWLYGRAVDAMLGQGERAAQPSTRGRR